jgi:uncharacterized protein DUF4262
MKDRLNPPEPHNPPNMRVRHELMDRWHKEMMSRHGFYTHFVIGGDCANIHTHGVNESFHHTDIQIALPISQQTANNLLHGIVEQIKKGKKFVTNVDYSEIANMPVRFIHATECDRPVLRLIIPDRAGTLAKDTMDPVFARQYENLNSD